MADTQFDSAMAKAWEAEVRQELQAVDNLLIRVANACEEDPAEDDTLLNGIYDTGIKMEEEARKLGKRFEDTMQALSEIIKVVEQAVQDGMDKLRDFSGQLHL